MRKSPNVASAVPRFNGREVPENTGPLGDWPDPGSFGGSTGRLALASRAGTALLWALLIGAVLLSVMNFVSPPGGSGAAQQQAAAGVAGAAGGCAELVVKNWLAGDVAALRPMMVTAVPDRLPTRTREALQTYTLSTVPGPDATWVITVGAEIHTHGSAFRPSAAPSPSTTRGASPSPTPTTPASVVDLQYFQVPLAQVDLGRGCHGWIALTLPQQVGPPAEAGGITLSYAKDIPAGGNALADTLERFFYAYLAASGDVDRYTAPGAGIVAIDPAPYYAIRLSGLRVLRADFDPKKVPVDGSQVSVLATVMGQLRDGSEWPLTYPLRTTVRGGRFEVAALDPIPRMNPRAQPSVPVAPSRTNLPSPSPSQSVPDDTPASPSPGRS